VKQQFEFIPEFFDFKRCWSPPVIAETYRTLSERKVSQTIPCLEREATAWAVMEADDFAWFKTKTNGFFLSEQDCSFHQPTRGQLVMV